MTNGFGSVWIEGRDELHGWTYSTFLKAIQEQVKEKESESKDGGTDAME